MTKPILIKGGIVLTLDKAGRTGIFDLTVKNGKISTIDYEGRTSAKEFLASNPGGEVIDANGKIIIPGLFNSRLISSYSHARMFFTKCSYENLNGFVSLNLIDRYLSENVNKGRLEDILELTYRRALKCGETFINEASPSYKKQQAADVYSKQEWIKQNFNITSFDSKLVEDPGLLRGKVAAGFRADENINSYAISSFKRLVLAKQSMLIVDASLSVSALETLRQTFGKPFVNVLNDSGLLGNSAYLTDPCILTDGEIGILKDIDAGVIICPSDAAAFSGDLSLVRRLFNAGVRVMAGTGLSGSDILSELKILAAVASGQATYEEILRSATTVPSSAFGFGNVTGSIERMKSADLVVLSLRDLRNSGGLPDFDCESVCWHIIKYLSTKDITDVLVKGEIVYNSATENKEKDLLDASKSAELASLLYSAGKFREYREKKLREKRVGKLETGTEEEPGQTTGEVFVDVTETGEYIGEGSFTILGSKIEDFRHPREDEQEEKRPGLVEIRSIEEDMNLLDDDDLPVEEPRLGIRLSGTKTPVKTILQTPVAQRPVEEKSMAKNAVKLDDELEDKPAKQKPKTIEEPVQPKRSTLRFGFRDGE